MKKQLVIAIAIGAATLAYFILRKKYTALDSNPEPLIEPPHTEYKKKHHLTNAFANAKKHVLH